ncbi:MAG TPA: hypothetical protein VGJ56_09995 [Reyranella sp.]
MLASGRVQADGLPIAALHPDVIDAACGVGFRAAIVDGVIQPIAWVRRDGN